MTNMTKKIIAFASVLGTVILSSFMIIKEHIIPFHYESFVTNPSTTSARRRLGTTSDIYSCPDPANDPIEIPAGLCHFTLFSQQFFFKINCSDADFQIFLSHLVTAAALHPPWYKICCYWWWCYRIQHLHTIDLKE